MSQQPNASFPKKVSLFSDYVTPNESTNPKWVLHVSPLRMISADDLKTTKSKMSHASKPKEGVRTKVSNPSSSNPREELTKKGTRYVHNSIVKIVNQYADNTNVTEDVNVIRNSEADDSPRADARTGTNVMDLDEYSNNDLVATVNPNVAKRLMNRRKGKAVIQNSPIKKADVKNPSKDSVKKKSTFVGPIKRRVVAKSVGVGPSKSWNKVVPKKRKERAIEESESDVEVNVHDTPLKKKPTTSKLAATVSKVPINNVSFHFAASANRWKFGYQKRLALERELAQNARDCKDIMDLIQAAGLIKLLSI
ncbi:uncharacterized protein LOC131640456 [Vicia villosa]|uniref:uncharacterized protein LOC131640456 n=1 Tax=Vicia villosa TaxID=3911 RepID=UPI00273AC28B|nr:uncharacterized protein LOC131640456 [Vicia villosa]